MIDTQHLINDEWNRLLLRTTAIAVPLSIAIFLIFQRLQPRSIFSWRDDRGLREQRTMYQQNHCANILKHQLTREHVEPIALRQWKKVLSWIAFHPDEVASFADHRRQTVLHHACLFRAPSHVIESILLAAPELASITNIDGEPAIQWAVRLSLPNEVMKLLLKADPMAGFIRDKDGNTALSLIWERHQETILDALREGGPELVKELPSWKMILNLFRSYYQNANDDLGQHAHVEHHFSPLHAAAFCPCPPAVFPLLLRVYATEIHIRDENGRSPLAIAATSPAANRSCDVLTKIELLLREFPEAAKIRDSLGRLPLALAVESRIPWDEGTHALLRAEPSALLMRDPATCFYPFMLAAAETALSPDPQRVSMLKGCKLRLAASEVSTIYHLLRADPGQICLLSQSDTT